MPPLSISIKRPASPEANGQSFLSHPMHHSCIHHPFQLDCSVTRFSEFTEANVSAEAFRSMVPVVNAEAPAVIAAFQQMRQSHFIE